MTVNNETISDNQTVIPSADFGQEFGRELEYETGFRKLSPINKLKFLTPSSDGLDTPPQHSYDLPDDYPDRPIPLAIAAGGGGGTFFLAKPDRYHLSSADGGHGRGLPMTYEDQINMATQVFQLEPSDHERSVRSDNNDTNHFLATNPDSSSSDWRFNQVLGPNWGANWQRSVLNISEVSYLSDSVFTRGAAGRIKSQQNSFILEPLNYPHASLALSAGGYGGTICPQMIVHFDNNATVMNWANTVTQGGHGGGGAGCVWGGGGGGHMGGRAGRPGFGAEGGTSFVHKDLVLNLIMDIEATPASSISSSQDTKGDTTADNGTLWNGSIDVSQNNNGTYSGTNRTNDDSIEDYAYTDWVEEDRARLIRALGDVDRQQAAKWSSGSDGGVDWTSNWDDLEGDGEIVIFYQVENCCDLAGHPCIIMNSLREEQHDDSGNIFGATQRNQSYDTFDTLVKRCICPDGTLRLDSCEGK